MDSREIARLLLFPARLAGVTAVVLTLSGYAALALLYWWDGVVTAAASLLFALLAIWGVLRIEPLLPFAAYLGSFFLTGGWYTLLHGGYAGLIGTGAFSYAVAGALTVVSAVAARTHSREMAP